jgi:cysteinyl-tRNA synthetase
MHGGHLLLGGTRMAKSAGNFFRITELVERGFDPLGFRYLMLQAKYRTKLNFSTGSLAGADRALRQLRERVAEWSAGEDGQRRDYDQRFRAALADDLDLPAAMALVAEVSRSELAPGAKARLLVEWDRVLGLDLARPRADTGTLPDGAADLLAQRERARAAKDFATSDRLRDQLGALGVSVTDTAHCQKWRRG